MRVTKVTLGNTNSMYKVQEPQSRLKESRVAGRSGECTSAKGRKWGSTHHLWLQGPRQKSKVRILLSEWGARQRLFRGCTTTVELKITPPYRIYLLMCFARYITMSLTRRPDVLLFGRHDFLIIATLYTLRDTNLVLALPGDYELEC